MEEEVQDLELIDRYLSGEMDARDKRAFETRLQSEPVLKRKVEEMQWLLEGVAMGTLKGRLREFHDSLPQAESADPHTADTMQISWMRYAVAASLAIVAGVTIWWFADQSSIEQELFAQYFEPDPGLVTAMSQQSNYQFYEGMVAYKRGHYDEAIATWDVILEMQPHNDTLNYYLGVSYLAQGDQQKAIPYLRKSTKVPASVFMDESYHYLGLAALKNNDRSGAIQAFERSGLAESKTILSLIKE